MRPSFIERTIGALLEALDQASGAERIAAGRGLLQSLDARVKVAGLVSLVISAVLARKLIAIVLLFALAVVLAVASRVPMRTLMRSWLVAFLFTGVIVAPALFLSRGRTVVELFGVPVAVQGLRSAAFLIGRIETSTTFALLLAVCTPWPRVLAALRLVRVPVVIVAILGMTYRYIFVLLQAAHDMFVSRRSRTLGRLAGAERRRLATATAGVLLSRTLQLGNDVYLAMQARGFRGEVYLLNDFRMRLRDWSALAALMGCVVGVMWLGR
jgi:cobalt/nickel transport system permease protein